MSYYPTMITYKKSAERREQILNAACKLAEESHYNNVRRHHLVTHCETAAGNISRVMGSMKEMRTQLIEYALFHDRSIVIAQAITDKHPAVDHLDVTQRRQHLAAAA